MKMPNWLIVVLCLLAQTVHAQYNARNSIAWSKGAAFVRPAYLHIDTTSAVSNFLPGKISSPEAQQALSLLWQQEIEQSIAYTSAMIRQKKSKELYEIRAMGYQQLLQNHKAIRDYKKALAIIPDDTTYQAIAFNYYDIYQYSEALQWTREGLELYPNSATLWVMLASITHQTADDWRKAIPLYLKAAELEGTGRFYNFAGGECWEHRDRECAAAYISMAIEAAPDVLFYYDRRGEVYMEGGLYDRAIDNYLQAIEQAPENKGFWHGLANAYFAKGDESRKKEALEKYRELGGKCSCDIHKNRYDF